MSKPPAISDAEWEVMNVLWSAEGPLMASEVIDLLPKRIEWSPRTVKTMLNRLIRKRALRFEQLGKRYLYRPAVQREQCVRAESRSFLARVFGGSAAPMLAHFVAHADLSAAEVEELQLLLQKRQRDAGANKKGR